VAPGGKGDVPLGLTPTGAGSVMPRAEPTVPAVGHVLGAAVMVGSATADTVGVEPGGVPAIEPPQAASAELKTSRASANRRELSNDTFTPAMVLRLRPLPVLGDYAFRDGLVRAS
jgi:hypothetical protein